MEVWGILVHFCFRNENSWNASWLTKVEKRESERERERGGGDTFKRQWYKREKDCAIHGWSKIERGKLI